VSVLIDHLPWWNRHRAALLIKEARERQRRRLFWLAVAVLAAVCAGGIGYGISQAASGGSAGSATNTVPNPCLFLSNSQVAKTLGNPIQLRNSARRATGYATPERLCTWTAVPFSSRVFSDNTLVITIWRDTKTHFVAYHQLAHHVVRISGVGESAYASTGPAWILDVFAHGYVLSIQQAENATNPIATDAALAKLAVTRLPR
jgi:hypothetical protein